MQYINFNFQSAQLKGQYFFCYEAKLFIAVNLWYLLSIFPLDIDKGKT